MRFEVAKALAQARSFGLCEGCRAHAPLDPHHRMTRGSGGVHGAAYHVSNDPRNLLMLCRGCHDMTLTDAPACIAIGWVIERRAGVDPREVPTKIHTVNGYGWWYLTDDGGYLWGDRENLTPNFALSYRACEPGELSITLTDSGTHVLAVTMIERDLVSGSEQRVEGDLEVGVVDAPQEL